MREGKYEGMKCEVAGVYCCYERSFQMKLPLIVAICISVSKEGNPSGIDGEALKVSFARPRFGKEGLMSTWPNPGQGRACWACAPRYEPCRPSKAVFERGDLSREIGAHMQESCSPGWGAIIEDRRFLDSQ